MKIKKYGIEITKPWSKEMYAHNDSVAEEMRINIEYEMRDAHRRAIGTVAANGGMDKGEEDLRNIVRCFTGYAFGDGYDLEDIKNEGIKTLHDAANWQLHEEYGYLCHEDIVPWIKMKMLGFDNPGRNQSLYWEEEDPNNEFVSPALESK